MDCIVHRVPKSWTQLSYFHHKYQNISLVYIPSAFEDVVYLFHMFQMPTVIFNLTNAKFETCPANPCLVSSFLHDQILIKGRESGKAENVWSLREGRGSDLWIASQGLLFSFHSHSTSWLSEWNVTSWESLCLGLPVVYSQQISKLYLEDISSRIWETWFQKESKEHWSRLEKTQVLNSKLRLSHCLSDARHYFTSSHYKMCEEGQKGWENSFSFLFSTLTKPCNPFLLQQWVKLIF